jgi:hypothetical protein
MAKSHPTVLWPRNREAPPPVHIGPPTLTEIIYATTRDMGAVWHNSVKIDFVGMRRAAASDALIMCWMLTRYGNVYDAAVEVPLGHALNADSLVRRIIATGIDAADSLMVMQPRVVLIDRGRIPAERRAVRLSAIRESLCP